MRGVIIGSGTAATVEDGSERWGRRWIAGIAGAAVIAGTFIGANPVVSAAAEATAAPETPAATAAPEATEAPAATGAPAATEAPAATAAPAPTDPPEQAGIYVVADLGGRRNGAWIGSSGTRVATERTSMRGNRLVSVCPEGDLAIEVTPGEPVVHVRDLATTDSISTIDPRDALAAAAAVEDAPPEDVACRSADATDILYRWGYAIRGANGAEIVRTAAWQSPFDMDGRIAVGAIDRGRAAEIVDLATGRIGRIGRTEGRQRITKVAIAPSGEKVAMIISDRDRDIAVLVDVTDFIDAGAAATADVRLVNLSGDAADIALATTAGGELIAGVAPRRAAWGRVAAGPHELVVLTGAGDPLDVGSVELATGPSTSIVVTGSSADGTLAASVVADTDATRSDGDAGTAVVRVLNGLADPLDLELRERGRPREGGRIVIPIAGLEPGGVTEYQALVDDLRLTLAGDTTADVSTPGTPGYAYTVAIAPAEDAAATLACAADPSTADCVAPVVLADRPAAPAGTELAAGRITRGRVLENTPVWVDDDTLAVVLHHQLGIQDRDDAAGAVTLHSGADLLPMCTWTGWDARPVASADGVLFGWKQAIDPKRPTAVGARGGKDRRLGKVRGVPYPGAGDSIIPLPAFDGSAFTRNPDAACAT